MAEPTSPRWPATYILLFLSSMARLFDYSFLKILGEVGPDLGGGPLGGDLGHVAVDHDVHKLLERGLRRVPPKFGLRLCRVTPEVDHVRGAVEVLAHGDERLPDQVVGAGDADSGLVDPLAMELQLHPGAPERMVGELPHAVLHSRGDDEVLGPVVLEDKPHALDVVLGVAPVTERAQVAEVETVLKTLCDPCGGEGDLSCDERLAPPLGLVVEQDPGAAEHAVGLAVFLDDPVAVKLGDRIGRVRVERGVLVLRHLLHLAVELAC